MTTIVRSAVCRPPFGAVLATCCALATPLAACGPEPAEIDRGPVAAATGAEQDADQAEVPARRLATLALHGDPAYDGPAEVACGPLPASGGHPEPPETGSVGRPEAVAVEGPAEEEEEHPEPDEGRRFELTLSALDSPGLAVTLRLPEGGHGSETPLLVASIAPDGSYRESTGVAEVALDDGSTLTRSSATDYLSGRFSGRYQGEAGSGEVEGRFPRCYYFD